MVFLDPSNDYNISGSQGCFTTPPQPNDDIVMIALAAASRSNKDCQLCH